MSLGGKELHQNCEIITFRPNLCSTPLSSVTANEQQQQVCVSLEKVHT